MVLAGPSRWKYVIVKGHVWTLIISHLFQNGSLWDGLALWKSNLDKHFAGVEDCMICFSVIHASNYSLPKMSCRTCKKRFHNACLVSDGTFGYVICMKSMQICMIINSILHINLDRLSTV